MTELPLVLLGGILGSSHCLGMCGGFALMIGFNRRTVAHNLLVQTVYSAGRISTYVFLGAVAGYLSMRVSRAAPMIRYGPAALCLLAGLLLIVQGLDSAGFRLRPGRTTVAGGCSFGSQFASLLRGGRIENVFAAGILTGLLPCGLVYAFLSLAASTGSIGWGAAVMATFGLGTVPLMVLTGLGTSFISLVTRRRMMHVAAWCVVLTGMLTMARGAAFLRQADNDSAPVCPFCSENE